MPCRPCESLRSVLGDRRPEAASGCTGPSCRSSTRLPSAPVTSLLPDRRRPDVYCVPHTARSIGGRVGGLVWTRELVEPRMQQVSLRSRLSACCGNRRLLVKAGRSPNIGTDRLQSGSLGASMHSAIAVSSDGRHHDSESDPQTEGRSAAHRSAAGRICPAAVTEGGRPPPAYQMECGSHGRPPSNGSDRRRIMLLYVPADALGWLL